MHWKTVYVEGDGKGGVVKISFKPSDGRYIRLYGDKRATQWRISLWDILVHGE